MKKILFAFFTLALFSSPAFSQSYKKLHEKAIVIDTHNDFISTGIEKGKSFDQNLKGITHSDLKRMKEGGIDVQVFSIFCDENYGKGTAYAFANREIDTLYATVARNPNRMMIVRNSKDLQTAVSTGKLGAMMGVEGGHMIEDEISNLEKLHARGARYMTLTWNNSTSWASSAADERAKKDLGHPYGLNALGEQIVKRMNELGMIVDISHVGEKTFYDAIRISTKPVIASHSCTYALCPVPRNLTDEQIKAVGKNGGVIQLNFYSGFVDSSFRDKNNAFIRKHQQEKDSLLKSNPSDFYANLYLHEKYKDEIDGVRPSLTLLIDHLDHIVKLIGVNHVGLGSDFDGINSSPRELNDVTNMPLITEELMKRGYSKKDIFKILGGNFIRVLKANEQ
ncbi:MAG: membrane dipeptidase [Chitinophagia bacterium]|nr:membrane dipeptidase [Chitinophagia bacterium]